MTPNIKSTLKNLPKTFKIVPKWQNFAKSGHTGRNHERNFTYEKGHDHLDDLGFGFKSESRAQAQAQVLSLLHFCNISTLVHLTQNIFVQCMKQSD